MGVREDSNELEVMRHSFAHVLAQAVLRVYKDAKLGIGPAVENGFYHDFLFPEPISQEDLDKIERQMRGIINEEVPFQQVTVPKEQAFDLMHLQGQIFKSEILQQITDDEVSFYKTGSDFIDLCRGPHVEHTGQLGAFKLVGISGTHWNNDPSRPELQRIHGIAFKTEAELEKYLATEEERREHDHRKLAQKLGLYTFSRLNGAGLPLWLPKGAEIRKKIKDYIHKENLQRGYSYVITPALVRNELYEGQGRLEAVKDQLFPIVNSEGDSLVLRPISLPSLLQIYSYKKRSYRDLPYKISEFAQTYRDEKSGELSGLSRVRTFAHDSNLVICSSDQIRQELISSIKLTTQIYKDFNLDNYKIQLALRGTNEDYYQGSPKEWVKLEEEIVNAVKSLGLVAYESPGTAEKYGPGLNFMFKDVYNKEWQLGSINFDITAAKDYNLTYVNSNNSSKLPYVLYRTAIGSLERFFALLIEHYAGAFPLWLSSVQVVIIPISEKFHTFAQEVHSELIENDISSEVNDAPETMQNKIRSAQTDMIPYMLIIGEKEESSHTVSVRPRSGQEIGMMKVDEFIEKVKREIKDKHTF